MAYGYATAVALVLGHFLLGLPIQFSDSFGNMLKLSAPWGDLLYAELRQEGYLRPLLWGALKLVHDLSGGNYFAWFRGVHVAQVLALVLLYVHLVRPATRLDLAVVPFGLAVLFGIHTFTDTVREAFPINTFMTILVCAFAAAALALARHRWWNDVLAVLLFVFAALTVESGLLVWVIFTGAAILGARGVSRPGLAALALLLAGYFYVRFVVFDVGAPALLERASGFGFRILEPSELIERFGANPLGFYAYNVVTAVSSVLLSEPTSGVFNLTRGIVRGALEPSMLINAVASLLLTVLLVRYAWLRRQDWLARRFERDDRLVLLFAMVLMANAVISYPYSKEVIMSPAGAFLAVAGFVAVRHALASLPERLPAAKMVAAASCFALLGATWAVRLASTHTGLRTTASAVRTEWAYAEGTLRQENVVLNGGEAALFRTLRDDAVFVHPAPPPIALPLGGLLGLR
jgi:hypothetical protein